MCRKPSSVAEHTNPRFFFEEMLLLTGEEMIQVGIRIGIDIGIGIEFGRGSWNEIAVH